MHCPFCRHPDSRGDRLRETDEGQAIRRRRSPRMWTTIHHRRDRGAGRSQAQWRYRTLSAGKGDQRCAPGVPGTPGRRRCVEPAGSASRGFDAAVAEPESMWLIILGPLRELDEVAYLLRFASVYWLPAGDFARDCASRALHLSAHK